MCHSSWKNTHYPTKQCEFIRSVKVLLVTFAKSRGLSPKTSEEFQTMAYICPSITPDCELCCTLLSTDRHFKYSLSVQDSVGTVGLWDCERDYNIMIYGRISLTLSLLCHASHNSLQQHNASITFYSGKCCWLYIYTVFSWHFSERKSEPAATHPFYSHSIHLSFFPLWPQMWFIWSGITQFLQYMDKYRKTNT